MIDLFPVLGTVTHMYGLLPQVTCIIFLNERTGKLSSVRTCEIFTKMSTLSDESTLLKNRLLEIYTTRRGTSLLVPQASQKDY